MFNTSLIPLFDEVYFGNPLSIYYNPHCERNVKWKHFVPLHGFESKDVKLEKRVTEDGHNQVLVHAKAYCNDDDFCETKKVVNVPDNVEIDSLRNIVSKDGVVFVGDYKERQIKTSELQRGDNWNSIWNEMERMNNTMNRMINQEHVRLPKSEYEQEGDSDKYKWKVEMNVGSGFNVNDLRVRHKDNMIYVDGETVTSTENGKSTRRIYEAISIPEGVEQDKLKCSMNGSQLYIEAPAVKIATAIKDKEEGKFIPIENVESMQ